LRAPLTIVHHPLEFVAAGPDFSYKLLVFLKIPLSRFFSSLSSLFLIHQPFLYISHPVLQRSDMANSPSFEFLETTGECQKGLWDIKGPKWCKFCVDRRVVIFANFASRGHAHPRGWSWSRVSRMLFGGGMLILDVSRRRSWAQLIAAPVRYIQM
jgi:hypothetical protein